MNGFCITRNNFQILMDVIITNPTHTNSVQHASMTTSHATTIAAQNEAQSYTEQMLKIDFIPFAIETQGCPHPCFNSFLTSCYMFV
jgi:hypothetical protein